MVIFIIALFICHDEISSGQTALPDSSEKSFRLFEDDKILEITLKYDLTTYFRAKPQKNYLKANITFHLNKTDSLSRDIRLRTRGIFRNKYCVFPPIELNFKKANFGYTDLDSISKLKMVPECKFSSENEDYVLKEYLAYKLFNVLTDTSFRVRILSVTYVDTEKKRKPIHQYCFFLEPVEMLTARIHCIHVKSHSVNQKNIVPRIMDRLAIFNYMIGNYDWSVPGPHNVLILKPMTIDTTGLGIVVPYDFDWTGLVNTAYAIPTEEMGTDNVRERIFEGICRSKAVYRKELEMFAEKKNEFYKVINEFPYLNKSGKRDVTDYLDGFFDQLAGEKNNIISTLSNSCKSF